MNTALAFIRFRWLCLPRLVRTVFIATGLTAFLGAVIVLIVAVCKMIVDAVDWGGLAIIIVVSVVLITIAVSVYNDIEPSIKRKDKEQ